MVSKCMFYHVAGAPIQLQREDKDNPARVAQLYAQSKAAVESEIAFLLRERQRDPYRTCAVVTVGMS